MNQETKAWMVRIGSLLVILGFFFPAFVVSCTGIIPIKETVSLMDLVNYRKNFANLLILLYLIPIGAILTLVFSFLTPSTRFPKSSGLIVQLTGLLVGILGGCLAIFELALRLHDTRMIEIKPSIGILVLLLGYFSAIFGIFSQWVEMPRQQRSEAINQFPGVIRNQFNIPEKHFSHAPPNLQQPINHVREAAPVAAGSFPYLVKADGTSAKIILYDQFSAGRSRDNQLVLNDLSVSRQHAIFRKWQDAWYIQDLGSQSGIFVNSKKVPAVCLQDNDTIQIGQTTLIFKAVDG